MFGSNRILAIVPARGGSKGVPLKNIHPLMGRPLVALTGACISRCPMIDRAVVSTDHEDIAAAAEASGIAAPFRRPPEISGDRIGDIDVLVHALETMERLDGVRYDVALMLQPTSPMRRPEHIASCIERLIDDGLDAAWTVSETDSKAHPLKQLTLSPDGRLGYYEPAGANIIARQQLTPVYHRNGACYAFTRDCLLEQRTIKGARTDGVLTEHMVSIDTLDDFEFVEYLLTRRDAAQTDTAGQ